ncbi:MAG: hypothetical protein ACYDIA_13615 [Candidatus Humimicrobiaceae bacterium]
MSTGSDEINYPWYSKVKSNNPLQQGDFVLKCQIFQPTVEAFSKGQNIKAIVKEYDVIIMSQSCDLIAEKINLVLVCPFHSLTQLGNIYPNYRDSEMKNNLRKGFVSGMHLLNECTINGNADYLVVDFKSVYAVPLPFLKQIVSIRDSRIRLLPPYREHLSQSFARFFMRVGLPSDIPSFT